MISLRLTYCTSRLYRFGASRLFHARNKPHELDEGTSNLADSLTCKSQKLMLECGVIASSSPGIIHLLPTALRALNKLCTLIDHEMRKVNAEKIEMPTLSSGALWKQTGRWDIMGAELFRLKDRHSADYCLAPTHEEAVTQLVASQGSLSYKRLPVRLYQITRKFRDEGRPRFGLLRGKEFYMKDLYTFDASKEDATATYNVICSAYERILTKLAVPYVKVVGTTGKMGGQYSHEFHLPAEIGEDKLLLCSECSYGVNTETLIDSPDNLNCSECGSAMVPTKGIEVGHTFLLGTKYSSKLGALFKNKDGKSEPMQMGCYGLGLSRLLAAVVEVLSTRTEIRWPPLMAPYSICIIPPKAGSHEEEAAKMASHLFCTLSQESSYQGDVLLDDRGHMTIGKRLQEAKRLGIPFIIITGKKVLEATPQIEIHRLASDSVDFVTHKELFDLLDNRS